MIKHKRKGIPFWKRQRKAWLKSGLSQETFCKKRGHALSTFSRWNGIFKQDEEQAPKEGSQEPKQVFVASAPLLLGGSSWTFEVELGQGLRVRVASGFDEAELDKLLRMLGEAC